MEENKLSKNIKHKTSAVYSGVFMGFVFLILFTLSFFYSIIQAPKSFPIPSNVTYTKDQSIFKLTEQLYNEKYIKSKTTFKIFLKLSGKENNIKAGEYYFDKPLNVSELAHRFAVGDLNQNLQKITIPEGSTNNQIIEIILKSFPNLSKEKFIELTKNKEGYLFPDTYFFYRTASESEIVKKLEDTYIEKVDSIFNELNLSDSQRNKVIILASLLEEEGKTNTDKSIIAGIILNRLEVDMLLQIDATINYIKGRSASVSFKDLEIDSPYNTYIYKGLPPGPITNSGIDSIQAALNPTKSQYMYYLTGNDGNFYYSKTFEGHVSNRQKYLR